MPNAQPFNAWPRTVTDLLVQVAEGLYVPVYQRPYTWQADEINRLMDDLLLGANGLAAGNDVSTFLGSLILLADPIGVDPDGGATPRQVFHLIDGQQRTTSLILLCAQLLRQVSDSEKLLSQRQDLAGNGQAAWILDQITGVRSDLLLAISFSTKRGKGPYRWAPRLIRQSHDQWGMDATGAIYESDVAWYTWQLLNQEDAAIVPSPVVIPDERASLRVVLEAIDLHLDSLLDGESGFPDLDALQVPVPAWAAAIAQTKQPTAQGGTDPQLERALRLLVFTSYVLNGVLLIEVRPASEENAFALFEPLNTTGQLLTPLETLKPVVVKVEGGITKYMSSPSKTHMDHLDGLFPVADATARASISDFVSTFALADKGEGRIGLSLQPQRRYLRNRLQGELAGSITQQRSFVRAMRLDGDYFCQARAETLPGHLSSASETDRLFFQVMKDSKHTIIWSLLSRYKAVTGGQAEYLQVLRALVAFWALWRTSRTSTGQVDDVHRRLMREGYPPKALAPLSRWNNSTGKPNGALPSASDLKIVLRELLDKKAKVGDRAAWVAKVNGLDSYINNKALTRFLLLAAHDDLELNSAKPGHIKRGVPGSFDTMTMDLWRSHVSVEHVAPQNRRAGDKSYEDKIYNDNLVGRLGNLALLPGDLNTLVENRKWSDKRAFFYVLGETDPSKRLTALGTLGLTTYAQKVQDALTGASYMPFTKAVAANGSATFTASYIAARGKVLAELAYDRLIDHLL